MKQRLESLDILRGLDLFILVFFQPLFMRLAYVQPDGHILRLIQESVFTHVEWVGFHLWDQIMPLFLFMAGTSIPYAFARYKSESIFPKSAYYRVGKRILLLWVFGAIVQGNLLDLNIDTLYVYTDTLQAIACGYLFSVIIFILLSEKWMFVVTLILPVIYTLGMMLGDGYLPGENLAEQIDRILLGRFVYGATVADNGEVVYADWYHYSWVYASLNFVTTTMTGVLTGVVLKSNLIDNKKKVQMLLVGGTACLFIAILFSFFEPVIKRLWTSSMTFLSSGISILLMLFFYYWVDIKRKGKYLKWLKIYGMNSILAYMLYNTMNLSSLLRQWLHGLEQFVGDYYSFVLELAFVILIFLILQYCYQKKIFLKV